MHPPKHIAQITRYTVFSIPSIPLDATSLLTSSTPVSTETESYMVLTMPVNMTSALHSVSPIPKASRVWLPISVTMCGWRTMAQPAASNIDIPNTGSAGIFLAMRIPVTTGTMSVHSEILNFDDSVSV